MGEMTEAGPQLYIKTLKLLITRMADTLEMLAQEDCESFCGTTDEHVCHPARARLLVEEAKDHLHG